MVEFVSREAMVEAFMDALAIGDRAGGVVSIVAGRVATDVPGRDADERHASSGRTVATRRAARSAVERSEARRRWVPDPTPQELEARLEADVMDGLDPATLDEVDESSIPEPAR
jgi:hypothetical protein